MPDEEITKMLKSHHKTVHTWGEKLPKSETSAIIYMCSVGSSHSCLVAGEAPAVYASLLEIIERTAKLSNISFNDLMAMLTVTHFSSEAALREKRLNS